VAFAILGFLCNSGTFRSKIRRQAEVEFKRLNAPLHFTAEMVELRGILPTLQLWFEDFIHLPVAGIRYDERFAHFRTKYPT
jgi:hypothetical protein